MRLLALVAPPAGVVRSHAARPARRHLRHLAGHPGRSRGAGGGRDGDAGAGGGAAAAARASTGRCPCSSCSYVGAARARRHGHEPLHHAADRGGSRAPAARHDRAHARRHGRLHRRRHPARRALGALAQLACSTTRCGSSRCPGSPSRASGSASCCSSCSRCGWAGRRSTAACRASRRAAITGLYLVDAAARRRLARPSRRALLHLALPAATLAFPALATLVRFTRAGVLDVMQSNFVLYERAMGLPRSRHRLEVHPAQRAHLDGDPDRPALRHPARRRGRHRGGVRLAGHRHLRGELDHPLRLQRGDGLHGLGGRRSSSSSTCSWTWPTTSIDPARAARRERARWFVLARLARDRSALLGLVLIAGARCVAALLAPVLATHPDDVFELHPAKRLRAPGAAHWLGTDRMGSDVYSRLLFGARITILIGVIAVGASLLVGVPVGLVAGYYHGWFSDLLMRVSDIFLAVPQVVLAIAIAQTLGPSLPNVILALSATYWPWFARVVYAETRALQKEVFVESTAALGASPLAAHRAARAAQHRLADHRARLDRHGLHHPHRGRARLPRARAAAAHAGVGPDHRRVARVPARRVVVRAGAGPRHLPHRDGLQPARRRAPRRARPAPPARAQPGPASAMAELLSVRGLERGVRHRRAAWPRCSTGSASTSGRARSSAWSARAAAARPRWRARSSASCPPGAARIRGRRDPLPGPRPAARGPRAWCNDACAAARSPSSPRTPSRSLSPVFTVGTQIMDLMKWKSPRRCAGRRARPGAGPRSLQRYPRERRRADRDAVLETLRAVQIPEPERALRRLPHEFSGGQRQRLMIAMALLPRPGPDHRRRADHRARRDDPGADPPPARELVKERGVSVLFTTHDLGTAHEICDRVVVMYAGQEMEPAPTDAFFARPGPSLHAAAARQPADAPDGEHPRHPGRGAEPVDAAVGLPLPPALRLRHRGVPGRPARAARARARARVRCHHPPTESRA